MLGHAGKREDGACVGVQLLRTAAQHAPWAVRSCGLCTTAEEAHFLPSLGLLPEDVVFKAGAHQHCQSPPRHHIVLDLYFKHKHTAVGGSSHVAVVYPPPHPLHLGR